MRLFLFSLLLLSPLALPGALSASPSALSACEARFAAAPDSEEAAECFATVGRNQALIPEASARLEELIAQDPDHPWLLLYLGNLRWEEPRRAEEIYRQAAKVFEARGDANGATRARSALHSILTRLERFEEAAAEIERVEALARRTGAAPLKLRVAILRAKQLRLEGGDMQQAYTLLSTAQDTFGPQATSYTLQRDAFEELANLSFELGRSTEARNWYGRFFDLALAHGELRTAANARYGAFRVLVEELKETPRADLRKEVETEARELLDLATQVQHRELIGRAHLILGQLSSGAESQAHLDACLANMTTVKDRISCLQALARLRQREGDPQAALGTLQQAIALARESQSPWSWADILRERMRVSWDALPREQAISLSETALDWIESIRDQQSGDSSRAGMLSMWAEDYYWLAGRLLKDQGEGSVAEAFGVIERLRARALLEALAAARANPVGGAPEEQDRRRHELALEGIAGIQRRLLDPDLPADEREKALLDLRRLEIAEASLRALLVRKGQEPVQAVLSGAALLPEVQRRLAPDEALLSFQIGPNEGPWGDFGGGSWLLVATRDQVEVRRLGRDRVMLRPAIRLFNGLFQRRDGSEARPAAGLYDNLMKEGLDVLPSGVRRLVIVPDDALHQLPFPALRPTAGDLPLAYRYEITVVPSASLWLRWKSQRPQTAAEPLLALADPVPLGGGGEPADERVAIFGDPVRLGPLPHARREGKAAVRHLDAGSLLRMGDDASEGFFKKADLRRFSILHFATHAVVDEDHPDRSGVLLTAAPDNEDGILQLREIVGLNLDGRIVVLSSCRSASGAVLRGEGVLGLARAFFQSGANTVVASLWPLRDDDGAALFDRFYRHLGQGKSVAAALHAAQRERAEEGAPAYAWAGLVVLGDGDLVPLPGGRKKAPLLEGPVPFLAVTALLVGVGVAALHRRRRVFV